MPFVSFTGLDRLTSCQSLSGKIRIILGIIDILRVVGSRLLGQIQIITLHQEKSENLYKLYSFLILDDLIIMVNNYNYFY